jgi:hypothetical protein
MAAPSSAHTHPSNAASTAPTTQAKMHCGPPIARTINGITMNGPIPTMNVMFNDVASINPNPRSSFSGSLMLRRQKFLQPPMFSVKTEKSA